MITLKQVIAILCCMACMALPITVVKSNTAGKPANTAVETDSGLPAGSNLKITAKNATVEVQPAGDGQYRCDYDENNCTVTTVTSDAAFEITVAGKPDAAFGWEDRVMIYIPAQTYDLITGVSEKGGLKLSGLNTDIDVTNNAGSVMIDLPSDYDRTLNYTGISASGAVILNGNSDFAVSAEFTSCSVTVPDTWPPCGNGSSEYSYTSGSGIAKVNIELTNASFSLNNE